MVHPLVIDIRSSRTEHDILGPVGPRPTAGLTAFETDTPGHTTVSDDLVAQRDHLIPCGWHRIASGVEGLGVVPNQALVRRLEEQADQVSLVAGDVQPGLPVVGLQLVSVHEGSQIH